MDDKAESEAKAKDRRLDLSVAQVSGSALAAVIAALLAGKLGVYGTVIGAGVVSVVATTGGTVFHHLFKRTGEQFRDATTPSANRPEPRPGRLPVRGTADEPPAPPRAEDRTQLLPQASRSDGHRAPSRAHAGAYTGALPHAHTDGWSGASRESGEYGHGTVHGTRLRGWKRPLLAAGAVFALAMGTVTAVELVSGSSADGSKDGTTVSRLFQPEKQGKQQDDDRRQEPGTGGSRDGGSERPGRDDTPTPSPGASQPGGGTGRQTPDPKTSPSAGGGGTPSPDTTPAPSGSPGGGTSGDGKGGATGGQGTGGAGGAPSASPQGQNAAAGTTTGTGPGTTA
ncbi:hypothetical protein LE181_10435 [Streptomyces sp. SCA3-4]|uniref:hypothetical protein n=1 Tax=Streptomyces sichuanensis TaxID=2871810 RepID=UPI001CE233F1|nr:hypothetical protein [Streptomyces sichuanensis]MCA6092578.1 hypothetical protein [Streptomyces sichuanensis]